MNKEELVKRIDEINKAYRLGESIVSDMVYDNLIDQLTELDPEHILLDGIGQEIVDEERKALLPVIMASMNKVKSIEELLKWFKSKKIPLNTELVLTPKYDGLSLCVDEDTNEAWTRGNGIHGQKSDNHLKMLSRNKIIVGGITIGEVIMPRQIFLDKYADTYSNPRNTVSGQINKKDPTEEILNDCNYISYGMYGSEHNTKSEMLDDLNRTQKHTVPYLLKVVEDLSTSYLKSLFEEWCQDYEIDGIIIEVNSEELRESLGREVSKNNPAYARAYKGNFEELKNTSVLGITYKISKRGYLKPVIQLDPISLDGVIVSNVTGFNARFMLENGIGIGSVLTIKRSGMVIPYIVDVVEASGYIMPDVGVEIIWNDSGIELVTVEETEDQKFMSMVSFFNILDVDSLREGTLRQLFDNGFPTPIDVLNITADQITVMDKMGDRKAEIILKAMNDKRNVTVSKLQHASGKFKNLGSKKLLLLEHLSDRDVDTIDSNEIEKIEGFSEKSAVYYMDGLKEYNQWVLPYLNVLNVSKTEVKETGDQLDGFNFVFSGYRDKEAQAKIEMLGAKISSGVSAKVTHLVMKAKGSGSSKEVKAEKLGIVIWDVNDFSEFINNY